MCGHKVYEIYPWQDLTITKEDGTLTKEQVFIILDGKLEEFLFDATLSQKIKCKIKQRERGKKAQTSKKNLTVKFTKNSCSPVK